MIPRHVTRRLIHIGLSLLIFPLAVLGIGYLLAGGEPVHLPFNHKNGEVLHPEAASAVLNSLTEFLSAAGVSLVAGAGILLRFPERKATDTVDWVLAVTAFYLAIVSIYCGYRFRWDLATQLAQYQLDIYQIESRLEWQAALALASFSLLLALAVDRFRRTDPTEEN